MPLWVRGMVAVLASGTTVLGSSGNSGSETPVPVPRPARPITSDGAASRAGWPLGPAVPDARLAAPLLWRDDSGLACA